MCICILDIIWSTIVISYWDIGLGLDFVHWRIMLLINVYQIKRRVYPMKNVFFSISQFLCFSLCHIKPQQTTSPVTFVDPHFALTNKTMNREKVFKYSSDIYVWWLSLPCHLYKSLRRPYLERSKSFCFVSNVKTMP